MSKRPSTHQMGGNHNSVVVPPISTKFWWMVPMGVRDNHTKYELETQWWRLERASQVQDLTFPCGQHKHQEYCRSSQRIGRSNLALKSHPPSGCCEGWCCGTGP